MEILLLLIYAAFVWLIFIKLKLLPWTFVSQIIVITIPIVALTCLILFLNIVAPSSSDVRVINYVVQIVPRVSGRVTEVPIEPNRPIKKGDILFKIDPTPFEQQVQVLEAKLPELQAKLASAKALERQLKEQLKSAGGTREAAAAKVVDAQAYHRELLEQLKSATSRKESVLSRMDLAKKRLAETKELADHGAGPKFDYEHSEAELRTLGTDLDAATADEQRIRENLSATTGGGELAEVAQARAQMSSATANASEIKQKLSARTDNGDLADVAEVKAEMLQVEAQLTEARWTLDQAVVYAPDDGTVVNLQLRPGSFTSSFARAPVMSFVENEQWVVALYHQNELRKIQPGNDAEITLENYPNRIIRCKVDSIVWATGTGQMPITGQLPDTGAEPISEQRIAVRLMPDESEKDLFLAAGAQGHGAVYTDSGPLIHLVRKILLRVSTKMDWFILKLH